MEIYLLSTICATTVIAILIIIMAKNKKRKHSLFHAVQKQRNGEATVTRNELLLHPHDGSPPLLDGATTTTTTAAISDTDLQTTLRVIGSLTSNPQLFLHSKQTKDLRKALHPLVLMQLHTYDPIDYIKRVTLALYHNKWSDAMGALQGAREYQQIPKQGTIQRWVREVDGAPCQMKLLAAILRLAHTQQLSSSDNKHDVGQVLAKQLSVSEELILTEGWIIPGGDIATNDETVLDDTTATASTCTTTPCIESRVVYQENGPDRTPPNQYDLLLHTITSPGYITFSNIPPTITKHNIPFIDGGFVLDSVLTASECSQLVHTATHLGFRPDHPTTMDHPTGIDSCEWLVDHDGVLAQLFRRVQSHLPRTMQKQQNVVLYQLNARFRCFRYDQDCVYRPHIDGSWPESRLAVDGTYDCSGGNIKSYLTFLIYLNDDFDGGETRFYLPTDKDGMMARGIVPKRGAALVFPQGNTSSLIHEGSAVTRGTKYVIRTDVLYRNHEE